jgi:hypothetical protein
MKMKSLKIVGAIAASHALALTLTAPAKAADFNAEQTSAIGTIAGAMLAEENCPGVHVNTGKAAQLMRHVNISPNDDWKEAAKGMINSYNPGSKAARVDRYAFCTFARDPIEPLRPLLDLDD